MKKSIIVLGLSLAASVAVLCTAVGTLALNITDTGAGATITTPGMQLDSKVSNLRVYSAVEAASADTADFSDKKGNYYNYKQSTAQSANEISFSHGGKVSYNAKSVDIDGIVPGDKVEFDIAVTSESTISYNYRAELYVDATAGANLINELDFKAGSLGLVRKDVADFLPTGGNKQAPVAFTDWTTHLANQASVETVHVTVALPIDAAKGKNEKVKLYYCAVGVQNAEEMPDLAEVETGGQRVAFKTVEEAVEYAEERDISEIRIINGTSVEEGAIAVSDRISFVGVPDADGKYPVLKGARFSLINGNSVSFKNVNFGGASYIDVSNGSSLTLTDCEIDVAADKFFDTSTRTFLSDSAFIVSGSAPSSVRLNLTGNTIVSEGSAICMRALLRNGSHFSGNTFGSEEKACNGSAVLAFSGEDGGATVRLDGNTIYGKLPLSLGNEAAGARFLVVSNGNKAYGTEGGIFAGGIARAAFVDSGSVIEDAALTCGNIACSTLLFGGVGVTLNEIDRITAGRFELSANITESDFYASYVAGETLAANAVVIYRGGAAYGYMTSGGTVVTY